MSSVISFSRTAVLAKPSDCDLGALGLRGSRGCVDYRLHGAMNSLAQSGHVEFNPGEMPWHPPGGALHPVLSLLTR